MKNPPTPNRGDQRKPRSKDKREKQSGIAIVTVLSVLLLMSVLMLAFFSGAKTELESSRYYAASLRTRQLTDIVTSIVIAQIREGTAFESKGNSRTTWASQPGLITKFTDRVATSYEQSVASKHKLYSSHKMLADRNDDLTTDFENDWAENPNRWVDLNEPVYSDLDQKLYFPIVDPRAYQTDPKSSVEGFTYTNTTSGGSRISGIQGPSSNEDKQRVPMPVRWLYILDDGSLGHLDDSDRFVPASGGGTPSKQNPISARIAFWTDDESCKVNINTAAEGVPWDPPRYESESERSYSKNPPGQGEYYRYPGHPAMVSLSSIFYPSQDITGDANKMQDMLDISPRNAWENSSEGGTIPGRIVRLDTDRLYATVDELLYKAGGNTTRRENDAFMVSGSRSPRTLLERARFFLTANSVAPEMTMWGTPRMSLWPLPEQPGQRSVFDNLLAFCNELGKGNNAEKYYWQRGSGGSRHGEVYGRAGGANINLLWNYLAPHTNARVPGYGKRLNEKYGGSSGQETDNFQILTQIWDGVRTSNLQDPMARVKYGEAQTGSGAGQVASCCLCGGQPSGRNHATDAHRTRWSANGNKGKGFGRLYMMSEATLVFLGGGASTAGGKELEVGVLIETFCPSHGYSKVWPKAHLYIVTNNTGGTTANFGGERSPSMTVDSALPQGTKATMLQNNHTSVDPTLRARTTRHESDRFWGAHGGPELFMDPNVNSGVNRPLQFNQSPGDKKLPYRVVNGQIKISMDDVWRVILFDNNNASINQLIQFADIQWPSTFSIPEPTPVNGAIFQTWAGRISSGDPSRYIFPEDVTRSMVVGHGDYRLVSARRWTDASVFKKHHKFNLGASSQRHAHSLTMASGEKYPEATFEREMVVGAGYPENLLPDFPNSPGSGADNQQFLEYYAEIDRQWHPQRFSSDPNITGDWDTGVAFHLDGPYINRPDDGSGGVNNPYFDADFLSQPDNIPKREYFAPNRLVTGPGQFGSMPTGVRANAPWRTMLFRPDREHYGSADQPEPGGLPDHLYMDLFWMPVVEPYAISMPFATRGKLNLNYQIIPFDNIKRATGLHALMKAERMIAIPTDKGDEYKERLGASSGGSKATTKWRTRIEADETLIQAEDRFRDGEVFRSPTEICELYLVQEGKTLGDRDPATLDYPKQRKFWEDHRLTGDNLKERPYANMQPRLTTKSNVFKVHMIVQTVRKVRSSEPDEMTERDGISGEWRGSAMVERFIDPNNDDIPQYIKSKNPTSRDSLDEFYSYRVLHVKQFAP